MAAITPAPRPSRQKARYHRIERRTGWGDVKHGRLAVVPLLRVKGGRVLEYLRMTRCASGRGALFSPGDYGKRIVVLFLRFDLRWAVDPMFHRENAWTELQNRLS